jgi:hypothetical protein
MAISDSSDVNGNLTGRIAQQQAIGAIFALLRGFRVLYCRGIIKLSATYGSTNCTGTITAFSVQYLVEAEKIVNVALKHVERFASMYPHSKFETSCSLGVIPS